MSELEALTKINFNIERREPKRRAKNKDKVIKFKAPLLSITGQFEEWEVESGKPTEEGIQIAGIRTLRVLFMIAGAKILIASAEAEGLVKALGRLFSPLEKIGLPAKDFFQTMGLTLKCFPLLKNAAQQTYKDTTKAEDTGSFLGKVRTVSIFLLPMFIKSIQSPEVFFQNSELHEKKD